jgi:phosphonatase-like hydrolase
MRPHLVVFDLAGTTVHDPDGVRGNLRDSLAAVGLEVSPAAVTAVMGIPKPEALRRLIEPTPRWAELLPRLNDIHADFVRRMLRHYREDPSVYEIPGTSATFATLKRAGIAVAVDTGFSRDIVTVLLDRLGWERAGLIDASVTSDEVPRGRPHPDMVRHLMARFGVSDARLVAKVGDTPADLEEGVNAGCGWVIGVTQGSHNRAQLEPFPHTHLVGTVAEVPALLGMTVYTS